MKDKETDRIINDVVIPYYEEIGKSDCVDGSPQHLVVQPDPETPRLAERPRCPDASAAHPCPKCGEMNDDNWPITVGEGIRMHGCQMCWEAECSESWWEMVEAINRAAQRATNGVRSGLDNDTVLRPADESSNTVES